MGNMACAARVPGEIAKHPIGVGLRFPLPFTVVFPGDVVFADHPHSKIQHRLDGIGIINLSGEGRKGMRLVRRDEPDVLGLHPV